MAHWAEIDSTGVVLRVTVGDNAAPDEGYSWLVENLGGTWVQCSYNTHAGQHTEGGTPLRYNYPGEEWTYSEDPEWSAQSGAFIPPKPFPSWSINPSTALWDAPTPCPQDGNLYRWNEATLSWVEITALI